MAFAMAVGCKIITVLGCSFHKLPGGCRSLIKYTRCLPNGMTSWKPGMAL